MERKKFLGTLLPLGALLTAEAAGRKENAPGLIPKIPPYLKRGDMIGITCPAGYIENEDIRPAITKLAEWGFEILVGDTVGKRDFTFGGTDEERLKDLQYQLDHPGVKAILCARGGYGMVRIIDRLNFTKFTLHPKWILGFSDVTVLHAHLNKNIGIASIHSKMCNSFPADWNNAEASQKDSIESIKDCLTGVRMKYHFPSSSSNRTGVAEGVLIGGNLKTIETLAGTKSDINTDGKILFVEDTGEYLYSIDRMFWNLARTGKLSRLRGLIVGGFKTKTADDPTEEFGLSLQEIVLEKVRSYRYPVCFDFPVGHQKNNVALKCGVQHRLSITDNDCTLSQIP